jgi:choline kinase
MQALILAAGDGGRMRALSAQAPKSLLNVGGRPIILRVIEALRAGGVRDITIVTGYHADALRSALAASAPADVRLRFVENDAPDLGNARSIWAAREAMRGSFVLTMADHIADESMVRALIDGADGRCRLAVDRADASADRADEATLARVVDGRVVALGKALSRWNALDTGLFWCTPAVFGAITPALRDGEAGAVFATLARTGELDAVDVTGGAWIDIDTPQDLERAQAMFA